MTRLLGSIVLLLIVLGVIGYFRGWYTAETTNSSGHSSIEINVDKDAVSRDAAAAEEKAREAANQVREHLATRPATNP